MLFVKRRKRLPSREMRTMYKKGKIIVIVSMIRKSWRQSSSLKGMPVRTRQGGPWHQELLQTKDIDKSEQRQTLVGACALDVAGLLAAVANTLGRGLLGAVSGQMADLAAYNMLVCVKC
jgi:isoaspartyl peptidase/L-asparaginase-like protein (Ntn-hydrolase superfamily)